MNVSPAFNPDIGTRLRSMVGVARGVSCTMTLPLNLVMGHDEDIDDKAIISFLPTYVHIYVSKCKSNLFSMSL